MQTQFANTTTTYTTQFTLASVTAQCDKFHVRLKNIQDEFFVGKESLSSIRLALAKIDAAFIDITAVIKIQMTCKSLSDESKAGRELGKLAEFLSIEIKQMRDEHLYVFEQFKSMEKYHQGE